MSTKFAKKGHVVVDIENAKLAKVGATDTKSKKILAKANIKAVESTDEDEKPAKGKAVKAAKEAKPAKAVKAPKEKKEKAVDNRKIKLLVKENPKREGTAAYDKFALYKTSKTVAEFIEAGGSLSAIKYDSEKQFIEVN